MKVLKIVDAEISQGILVERIILGGFAMGGAMASYIALTSDYEFGGCFFWSAWIPCHNRLAAMLSKVPNKLSIPMYLCHGDKDDTVGYFSCKL